MSEATNVRLVRCPKCENLLPEITSYSVYQCGGCGTVLEDGNNGRRKKMRCGACSTIIIFTVNDNKLCIASGVEPDEDYKGNFVKVKKSTKNGISNKFHRGSNSREAGNKSGLPEKEKVILNQNDNTEERISGTESLSTEIELSSNKYLNTGRTFDPDKASREGDCLKGRNAAKSLIGGIGLSDSNRSNEDFEQEKARFTVNGHLIPARLIKKAEKLAGPIQPGNYWYDSRAGFWGTMGGPCLGIIPPFIEEFHHPMQDHCAGGDTHVFVNGRELNQKDLNLLVSRGLLKERERSYIIEISGRVLDRDTGEELESLCKLAPTMEKRKQGFGLKPLKADA